MQKRLFRTHSSSYFAPDFGAKEKSRLELAGDILYTTRSQDITATDKLILITNTHTKIDQIQAWLPQTELIIHPNSGYDNLIGHFPLPLTILGFPIRAQAVSEFILSSLLHHFAPVKNCPQWPAGRQWRRKLLTEQKILVVGLGHVGSKVTKTLQSLGCTVEVYDPPKNFHAAFFEAGKWDVVLICAELNQETHHLLNQAWFQEAREELLIINTARGEIIDEKAMEFFLKKHPQSFAVLDVFQNEPYEADELTLPNTLKTPHQAGVFTQLEHTMIEFEYKVIHDYLNHSLQDFTKLYDSLLLKPRKFTHA